MQISLSLCDDAAIFTGSDRAAESSSSDVLGVGAASSDVLAANKF